MRNLEKAMRFSEGEKGVPDVYFGGTLVYCVLRLSYCSTEEIHELF